MFCCIQSLIFGLEVAWASSDKSRKC